MPVATEDMLAAMVSAVVEEVHPERIYLFGSHARGQAGPESDVDLLIIEREPFGPGRSRYQEAGRIWDTLARFPVPKDILVFSCDEFEFWRVGRNHVIARAVREGKLRRRRGCSTSPSGRSEPWPLCPILWCLPTRSTGFSLSPGDREEPESLARETWCRIPADP